MADQGERFDEYQVRYKDPASGVDLTHSTTTDPKAAGKSFREHRAILAGGPGELSLEKRTVTRSPWEAVEAVKLDEQPA